MRFLVLLTFIALVGLIVLQGFLLRSAYELKEQAFRQNVLSAMISASVRLETGETVMQAFRFDTEERGDSSDRSSGAAWTQTVEMDGREDSAHARRDLDPRVSATGNAVMYHVGTPQRVRVIATDGLGRDSVLIDTLKAAGDHRVTFDGAPPKGTLFYRFDVDSTSLVVQVRDGSAGPILKRPATDVERSVLVSRVIDNLWVSERKPIEERLSPAVLDSVLKRSMIEAGIPLEFSYGILSSRADSGRADTVRMANPPGSEPRLLASAFTVPLSPANLFGTRYRLAVDFPGRTLYLLGQIGPALFASASFVALIALAFVATLRTIAKQGRLMAHMTDFINNMTHEFKTPLSTVALATEAIRRPDIIGREAKVLQYAGMIADEALRMKKQVDRILELAELEEGQVELTMTDVDLHELLRSVAEGFSLQVEARGGQMELELRAIDHRIRGDAVHLRNVFQSLLDNANKYSPETPAIRIHTLNRGDAVAVEVIDQGAGIPAGEQKRVFEKYYRLPKGNLHDVKGFGLGLSYVRLLVTAHGGEVALVSIEGTGTCVTVTLPLSHVPGGPAHA